MKLSDSRFVHFSCEEAPNKESLSRRPISDCSGPRWLLPGNRRKLRLACWTESSTTPETAWPFVPGISHRKSLVQPKKRLWNIYAKSAFAARKHRRIVIYICNKLLILLVFCFKRSCGLSALERLLLFPKFV